MLGDVATFQAVLFDWSLTIAHYPDYEWWFATALERSGRRADPDVVRASMAAVAEAVQADTFVAAQGHMDTSADVHRTTLMAMYKQAKLDDELAESLYALESDPYCRPIYPDVLDVLSGLHHLGVRIGLVSNIHFDVRPGLFEQGVGRFFDAFALSFELGVQKPDPAIFAAALEMLDVRPNEALMVGDTPEIDGAAARLGITTLILPRSATAERQVLRGVLGLVQ